MEMNIMSLTDAGNMPTPGIGAATLVALDRIATWNVYGRLQELSIPCHCRSGQPLEVTVSSAHQAMQLWSVVQQFTAPRHSTVDHLERCWTMGDTKR
jgi:hypothetical protein